MIILPSFAPILHYPVPATPWSPANASPWAWWDFGDTANTTIVSNAFSEVFDKSGNGHSLSQNVINSARPSVISLNGLNAASLDGSSDRMAASISPSTFTEFHVFALVNFQAAASVTPVRRIVTCFNSSSSDTDAASAFIPAGKRSASSDLIWLLGSTAGSFAPYTNQSWFLGETYHTGSTGGAVVNGGTAVTVNNSFGSRTIDRLILGANGAQSGSFWQGFMAEIVVFSAAQTNNTAQRMQGYLLHQRGLQSLLPAGHPYRNSPPMV